jgi:PucR C-terminal helix-turn-helix domain
VRRVATLQELVDALADRLERPVAIEDRRYRVLAYSAHAEPPDRVRLASILTREAPADVVAWLDERGLSHAQSPVRLPDAPHVGMGPRVAVPVRTDRVLGFVWLIDEGVGAEEVAAAEETAAAAAPLLARLRESERSDHALVGELLGDDAGARSRAAQALRERGLRGPVRVLAGPGVPTAPRRGLVRGPGAALLLGGEEVLAEVAGAIGVSGARARLEDARDALAEAETALRLAPALGLTVAHWDRLGAHQLLAPLAGAPAPAPLRRLLDHPDAEPLVATLEAYLDRAGDARAAAAALFIHRTSLYHRLRRIERIAGVDLRDGDDRLLLHVALRIRRLEG